MDTFSIGEVAVISCPGDIHHNMEVEITSELMGPGKIQSGKYFNMLPSYMADSSNGKSGFVPQVHLRKKKPPEESASWERIEEISGGWDPHKERELVT